jgi:hypothetical protein
MMTNPTTTFSFGSLLIESPSDENEEQFQAHVREIIINIYGQIPEWLKFKVGRRFERKGMFYREFLCPAGSVDSRIQLQAQQPGGLFRVIILRGMRSDIPYCSEIQLGIESEFSCSELNEVPI